MQAMRPAAAEEDGQAVITVILAAIQITLIIFALLLLWCVLTDHSAFSREGRELVKQLDRMAARALSADCQRRVDHLHVMKAIKGDSYAGQIGEFEVHTDESIPPGFIGVYTPKGDDSNKVGDSS